MNFPLFPKSDFLRDKWWHRLAKVVFVLWILWWVYFPIRANENAFDDCARLATNLSVDWWDPTDCERLYAFIPSFQRFFKEWFVDPVQIFLSIIVIVSLYFIPIGIYRLILYIALGEAWKKREWKKREKKDEVTL